jgi:hypothetical protein
MSIIRPVTPSESSRRYSTKRLSSSTVAFLSGSSARFSVGEHWRSRNVISMPCQGGDTLYRRLSVRERGFYRTGTRARPQGEVRIALPDGFSLGRTVSERNYQSNGYKPPLKDLPWEDEYNAAKKAAEDKDSGASEAEGNSGGEQPSRG